MKKKVLLASALAATLVLSGWMPRGRAFGAELKLAYANLQKALNDSEAGVKAKDSLKEEAKKLEEELNKKQEELKKLKDEIDKKKDVWNKETREAKEGELKAKGQEFQRQFMEYNEQLGKKKNEKEAEIIEDLRAIVEEIARKKGYTYVFERSVSGILYAPPDADITDEVIKTFNKKAKTKGN